MDIVYESKYHQLEEDNWWFVARRDIVYKLFRACNLPKDKAILEIGCSGGPLIKQMNEDGYKQVYGIDISAKAIELAKARGIRNVEVMDGTSPAFAPATFDLIIASDVLEHIEQAQEALQNWHTLLKPGGRIIIFVPAFPFLWSGHDVVNHHFRRYTEKGLIADMQKSAFTIQRSGYWNSILFVPTWLVRMFQKLKTVDGEKINKKGQLLELPAIFNRLLIGMLKLENKYVMRFKSPAGVSVFVIAEKNAILGRLH